MADYKLEDVDLIAVADAIRSKGDTSSQLIWPSGYIAAIRNIEVSIEIASFANAADSQLLMIIQAAMDHELDLQEDAGWAVGDVRTITIGEFTDSLNVYHPEQDADIVITSFDDYNSARNLFQFDFKDTILPAEAISSSNNGLSGYSVMEVYSHILPELVNALPVWLQMMLTPFDVKFNCYSGGWKEKTASNNKLALRSLKEVTGSGGEAESSGIQLDYYKVNENRIKKLGKAGTTGKWWVRSAAYSNNVYYITTSGSSSHNSPNSNSNGTIGIAPFGCIGYDMNKIKWSNASPSELEYILQKAHNGEIDLQQDLGWAIGDVKTISISSFSANGTTFPSMNMPIAISSFSDYMNSGSVLQFDFERDIIYGGRMNNQYAEVAYGDTTMKNVILPALVEALPSWFVSLMITFSVPTWNKNLNSIENVIGNKLALRSEIELTGQATNSFSGEGSQIPYYLIPDKIKKSNNNFDNYWLRSPSSTTTNYSYLCCGKNGSINNIFINNNSGIVPFGCL